MTEAPLPEAPIVYGREDKVPFTAGRFLLIDGDKGPQSEFAAILQAPGRQVFPVADGDPAVAKASSGGAELAVIVASDMNACRTAYRLYFEAGMPVVLVLPRADGALVSAAIEAGVFAIIVQPASREQVECSLACAWGRFRADALERIKSHSFARRLEERRFVEQAKWILVSTRNLSEPDAMKALQKQARDSRTPLIEIANAVIRDAGQG